MSNCYTGHLVNNNNTGVKQLHMFNKFVGLGTNQILLHDEPIYN